MNTVILIGRLTKDPELTYIATTGKAVAKFSLAVDRTFTGKDGQKQADFFNIVVWGKQAENVANYTSKGSQVAIRGNIQNRSYETSSGEKRYITEIIAEQVQFLSKAPSIEVNPGSGEVEAFTPKGLDVDGYRALEEDDVPF